MDATDSSIHTNLETKTKWYRNKSWNKLCRTRPSPNKNIRVTVLDKLIAKDIYSVLLLSSGNLPVSQKYFDKNFSNKIFIWKKMCVTENFQYKLTYNVLYLNKVVFNFGETKTSLC